MCFCWSLSIFDGSEWSRRIVRATQVLSIVPCQLGLSGWLAEVVNFVPITSMGQSEQRDNMIEKPCRWGASVGSSSAPFLIIISLFSDCPIDVMGRSGNSGQSGQWALSGLSGQWGLPKQSNLSGLSGLSDSGRTSRPHISYIDVTTYFFLTYSTSSRTLFSVREYYKFVGVASWRFITILNPMILFSIIQIAECHGL